MLNLSPPSYRALGDDPRAASTKKVLPRRPWYAPPIELPDPATDYSPDYGKNEYGGSFPREDYYDAPPEPAPAPSLRAEPAPAPETSSANPVSELSVTNGVHLREAALVAAGGASAALVLLAALAAVLAARRRKRSPAPPVLLYPPHDVSAPCYMTKEVNFSLPTLRSTSLGELHDVASVSSLPAPAAQQRSNSFTNTADLGMLDPALYKADIFDAEPLWPEGHVGRVWFTLKYEARTERLQVAVMKAKHLPSRTPALANACDPYVRIQLMPDERRVLQTKQKKKTCNPFFDETFVYQIPPGKLEGLTLKLSVLDAGRVGQVGQAGQGKQLIGHVVLPLSELEEVAPDEEPQLYKLDLEKEPQEPTSDWGELLVSLLYNENLHRLTVTVVEARGLKLDPSTTKREMVARVTQERACRGVRARRTAAVDVADDGSALVSECFHFRLRADELHTTSVTVQALQPHSVYAKDRLLGKLVLGSYMFARGRALQHWSAALAAPMDQVQQWHPLSR